MATVQTTVNHQKTENTEMDSNTETGLGYKNKPLTRKDLGDNIPRRGGIIAPPLAKWFLKILGWKVVGEIPNLPQVVCLAVPHTSNWDAMYAIPTLLSLDFRLNLMGKKSLFKNPAVGALLKWSGVIPIDRSKKGSVLQATIDTFKKGDPLFLGIAPEGTRDYTKEWKTGFYYLALGAEVPIMPIAMDYKNKEVRFMNIIHPSGDYEADLKKILSMYAGVVPKFPEKLSKPLQEVSQSS